MLLEERTSWLEIQALEKKFDSWSQVANDSSLSKRNTSASKPLASARDITKDLPPEVAAFEVKEICLTFLILCFICFSVSSEKICHDIGFLLS